MDQEIVMFVKKPSRFGSGRIFIEVPSKFKDRIDPSKQYIIIMMPLRSVLDAASL